MSKRKKKTKVRRSIRISVESIDKVIPLDGDDPTDENALADIAYKWVKSNLAWNFDVEEEEIPDDE